MTIADSLTLLNTTKNAIKTAIEAKGVTVGSVPFSQYATKIGNISTGGGGGTPAATAWSQEYYDDVYAAGPGAWVRNASWLALPSVADTESKFVGLHTVWPDANFLALSAAGDYTVDWGDGVVENITSGTTALHEYTYSGISSDTLTSDGYKQVIVTVTPQAGQTLTSLNLNLKHTTTNLQAYASGWLDILISGPDLTSLTISGSTTNVKHSYLQRAQLISDNNIASVVSMFNECASLTNIPNWKFRTTDTVDASAMFYNCYSLVTIPLLDTQYVSNMTSIFFGCASLKTIPLLDTSAVWGMTNMFRSCSSLELVPELDTSNSESMLSMFNACPKLRAVSFANTALVTGMNSMFSGCSSLESVSLPDTRAVTSMNLMFNFCRSLTSVSLPDTRAVTDMSGMFTGCSSLTSVSLPDTGQVTLMGTMFSGCTSLVTVSLFNTENVTMMSSMFLTCSSLITVPLFNTVKVASMNAMFQDCVNLKSVPLFDCTALTNTSNMFRSCTSLVSVPALSVNGVASGTAQATMFFGCSNLSRIDVATFKFTINMANLKLSADRLNEIYTNLATVTSQTINVTGNYGNASDNPSIATAKGWTVTG